MPAPKLGRGEQVAATSRNLEALTPLLEQYREQLLPLRLDTTDQAGAQEAIRATKNRFGRLDILVNNAGFGAFGAVKQISEEQLRKQFEVNVLGTFHVTQAVLPLMRQQAAGHILQISSVSGVATFPYQGAYVASKWAIEGMMDVLAQEVRDFGIRVTLVEPGPFGTDLHRDSSSNAEPQPQYDGLRAMMAEMGKTIASVSGDVHAAGEALLKIVDASEPPLRVFLGGSGPAYVPRVSQDRLKTWKQWEQLSNADGLGEAFPQQSDYAVSSSSAFLALTRSIHISLAARLVPYTIPPSSLCHVIEDGIVQRDLNWPHPIVLAGASRHTSPYAKAVPHKR